MANESVISIKIGNLHINMIDLYEIIQTQHLTPIAHMHEFFEIHIILDGSAKIKIMDELYDISTNDILVIPPNFTHMAINKSSDYKTAIFSFEFVPIDESTANKYECAYFTNAFTTEKLQILKLTEQERSIVNSILKNTKKLTIYNINKVNIEIANLMLEFANKISLLSTKSDSQIDISSNETSVRKYKIERYIQSNIITRGEKPSLLNLSKELYISPRQVERFIKKVFNTTFKNLCLKCQLIIAKSLIEEGNLSIEKIAYKIGFSSYNGFLAAYKKHFGVLPSQNKISDLQT